MSNKFRLRGIGLVLGLVLVFLVSCSKRETEVEVARPDLKSAKVMITEDRLDEAKDKINEVASEFPDAAMLGEIYFNLAKSYEKKGERVKALDIYQLILNNYQNVDNILEVQEKVGRFNIEILFSPIIADRDVLYDVEPGDTLSKIARKFKTTVDLIKISNSLENDTIRAHSKLKVSKARYKILIDKSQNLLTLLFDDDKMVKTYSVSTGENNSTPVGTFTIVNKIKDPVWYTEGAIVPAESPDNILGSRWLGFSAKGYGIHGTVDPDTLGRQATRGCVRMLNSNVEELYVIVPVRTMVTIVD